MPSKPARAGSERNGVEHVAVDQQTVTRGIECSRRDEVAGGGEERSGERVRETKNALSQHGRDVSAALSRSPAIVPTMRNDKTVAADACSDSKPFDVCVTSIFRRGGAPAAAIKPGKK